MNGGTRMTQRNIMTIETARRTDFVKSKLDGTVTQEDIVRGVLKSEKIVDGFLNRGSHQTNKSASVSKKKGRIKI